MTKSSEGTLQFSIDARHIRQLGRELVADRVTAVSELVKNAYDADAENVSVIFSDGSAASAGGVVTITDDGQGMSLQDISDRWMVVSTGFKDDNAISEKFGRARAGQKGIGRFATESLGSRLTLSSTCAGSDERIVVEFNWHDDYIAGANLESIENAYKVEDAPPDDHGTTLRITPLHDRWEPRALQRIRDAVLLLQPPFRRTAVEPRASSEVVDPGFAVSVRYESEEDPSGVDHPFSPVLDAATAWIEGEVDADGTLQRRVSSEHLRVKEADVLERRSELTGAFSFRVAYLIFSSDALNPDASIGVRKARRMAETFGGIRLYRDELRTLPYGEPGNDWLGLDAIYRRRGQVLAPIGNANFFGEILVTRSENILFVDTASREGVVENEAFEELRSVVQDTLVWGVNAVAAVRQRKISAGTKRTRAPESRTELLEPLLDAAESLASAKTEAQRSIAIDRLTHLAESTRRRAQKDDSDQDAVVLALLDELSLLRVLASVGSAVAIFSHEVRAVLSQALGAVGDVAEIPELGGTRYAEQIEAAEAGLAGIGDLAAYLDLYVSQSRRRSRAEQPVADVLDNFVGRIGPLLSRRGVEIDHSVTPGYLRTAPMSRSELEAILYNFLTNALRAMDDERRKDRKIRISAVGDAEFVRIRFQDTGHGIPDRVRERIFHAFVTTTEESDAELGAGTGLGLKIVADVAELYGGTASLGEPDPGYNTCMQIDLPRSSERRPT
jgi:signal transduction histidine kinase